MEATAYWPFDEPPDAAAITTGPILEGSSWIALVGRDDDAWQFVGPEGADMAEAKVVCLDCVLELDRSIADLADLPLGWRARRDGPKSPWKRSPR